MAHRTESKTSPRRIQAVMKQRQALEMRMAGHTYDQIAHELGYKDHTSALYSVKKALQKTLEPPAQQYRALTLERLTMVMQTFWPAMLTGDDDAARTVLHALKDIRQLMGLDAPQKVEHAGDPDNPIRHQVMTIDLGDVTSALQVLADAGAVRLEPNGIQPGNPLDRLYPASTND